jgi:hypothetical protein
MKISTHLELSFRCAYKRMWKCCVQIISTQILEGLFKITIKFCIIRLTKIKNFNFRIHEHLISVVLKKSMYYNSTKE